MSQPNRALVLNATFEPLGIVSSRRAVLLVLDTKAELVHTTDRFFRAERIIGARTIGGQAGPLRLHSSAVPDSREPSYRVRSRQLPMPILRRRAAENLDHVIPRSKGGPHTWENVVAACRRCNTRKEDRLPHEAGMALRRTPIAPHHRVQLLALCGGASEDWRSYLETGAHETSH